MSRLELVKAAAKKVTLRQREQRRVKQEQDMEEIRILHTLGLTNCTVDELLARNMTVEEALSM